MSFTKITDQKKLKEEIDALDKKVKATKKRVEDAAYGDLAFASDLEKQFKPLTDLLSVKPLPKEEDLAPVGQRRKKKQDEKVSLLSMYLERQFERQQADSVLAAEIVSLVNQQNNITDALDKIAESMAELGVPEEGTRTFMYGMASDASQSGDEDVFDRIMRRANTGFVESSDTSFRAPDRRGIPLDSYTGEIFDKNESERIAEEIKKKQLKELLVPFELKELVYKEPYVKVKGENSKPIVVVPETGMLAEEFSNKGNHLDEYIYNFAYRLETEIDEPIREKMVPDLFKLTVEKTGLLDKLMETLPITGSLEGSLILAKKSAILKKLIDGIPGYGELLEEKFYPGKRLNFSSKVVEARPPVDRVQAPIQKNYPVQEGITTGGRISVPARTHSYKIKDGQFGNLMVDLNALARGHLLAKKHGKLVADQKVHADVADLLMNNYKAKKVYDGGAISVFKDLVYLSDLPANKKAKKYELVTDVNHGGCMECDSTSGGSKGGKIMSYSASQPTETDLKLERLQLLIASRNAGNDGKIIRNEINTIVSWLFDNGAIDKKQAKQFIRDYVAA